MPWLRTVALRSKEFPAAGLLSLTVRRAATTKSGAGAAPTVTATPLEQLFSVSDSLDTVSTHAP